MPPLKDKPEGARKTKKQSSKTNVNDGAGDGDDWNKPLLKPEDQLELTEPELAEEIPKALTSINTNVIRNLCVYSYKEGIYVPLPTPSNTVTLFSMKGTALHYESPEAMEQMREAGIEFEFVQEDVVEEVEDKGPAGDAEGAEAAPAEGGEPAEGEEGAEGSEGGGDVTVAADETAADEGSKDGVEGAGEDEDTPAPVAGRKKQKLINQFNYCERASLTFFNPSRCVSTQTIAPPRSSYGATILQWTIYDWYAEDFEQQQREKEKEKRSKTKETRVKVNKNWNMEQLNKRFAQCWQTIERIVIQNNFDDIAQDYRYYEDPSDEFREGEGTLLPLWKFSFEKTKKLSVTDICFNTNYYDLFAVCYGSHEFMNQKPEGVVCLYTLKNPAYPDYRLMTQSGAMCVDIHPKYCFLVVVGLSDGNVAVYNLQVNTTDPVYTSIGIVGKHTDLVTEVSWAPDMPDGEINFFSTSIDGRVLNWVLAQSKLLITPIITLVIDKQPSTNPDGIELTLRACATSMVFHPTDPEVYMVGTERGEIFKCCRSYSSKYLMEYKAHFQSVYRMDYNKYNSDIFASCGADWRVKVWEDMRSDPLLVFDLGASVGDVKWAPYSTTVLAACTSEGKVFVFDVNVNRYKAICIQQVVKRKTVRLTRLSFNAKLPFIIVGDDTGAVNALKMSPNLRLRVKPPKKQLTLDQTFLQNQKLEKLLTLVRELPD